MSTLTEFAIFPTDKGSSVSEYVAQIIEMIHKSGIKYQLTSMGTIIETENVEEALEIIAKSHKILEPFCDRIYISAKIDFRKSGNDRISEKINSVKSKIGNIST